MKLDYKEELQVHLKRKNISYTDLARRLGRSPQSVAQLLKADNISVEKLREICAAAGLSVEITIKDSTPEA